MDTRDWPEERPEYDPNLELDIWLEIIQLFKDIDDGETT